MGSSGQAVSCRQKASARGVGAGRREGRATPMRGHNWQPLFLVFRVQTVPHEDHVEDVYGAVLREIIDRARRRK